MRGGRVLTQAPHGIPAEDLAGPLGPEVVTGNIFTVALTEHQLVAVFFLLRFQISWAKTPCLCKNPCVLAGPFPKVCLPLQAWAAGAALSLTACMDAPYYRPQSPGMGSRQLRSGESQSPVKSTPILLPWDGKCLVLS